MFNDLIQKIRPDAVRIATDTVKGKLMDAFGVSNIRMKEIAERLQAEFEIQDCFYPFRNLFITIATMWGSNG